MTYAEAYERVQAMIDDDGQTWDLSPNDQEALRLLLSAAPPQPSATNEWELLPEDGLRVPYPEFCRHPDQCAGKSYCPRDPTCAD